MPDSQLIPLLLASSALILALSPDSFAASLAFGFSVALLGFTRWLDLKRERHNKETNDAIQELRTKVDNLILGKSLGR